MSFAKALPFVLKYEGGYVNHPADRGGPTNKGITQRTYDIYRKNNVLSPQDVRKISNEEVAQIYKSEYWDKVNGDLVQDKIALFLFDTAVNSGPKRAIKFLQRALGLYDDGVIGPITKESLEEAESKYPDKLLDRLFDIREHFFKSIGVGTQKVFLKGWLNRLAGLKEYIKNEY